MKFPVIILTLVATVMAANTVQNQWNSFKSLHDKRYRSPVEERLRFNIFKDNLRKIEEHNAKFDSGMVSYKMGVTKFADMTHDEFIEMLTYNKVSKPRQRNGEKFVAPLKSDVPEKMDWRQLGAVTEVKDQGQCGSCWSFSATGSIEGQNFIVNKKLVSLSEQNLVDCSGIYGDMGCLGGLMDYAFEYVIDNGLMAEDEYPYTASDGMCHYSAAESVVRLKSFVDIPSGDEEALRAAVGTIGPISVAVDASDFQLYYSGILNSTYCGNTVYSLDHGVLAVGYDTTQDGVDYWIVKNSWGSAWGEDGYIRMIRNKNMCGISTESSFPQL